MDKSAADTIAASLTEEGINKELDQAGLPSASLLEAAAVVNDAAASGNQTAIVSKEAVLLMSPGATVGGAIAVSFIFAGVAAWIVQDLPEITHDGIKTLYLLDLLDTIFDWGSWIGTNLEGDFTFANDKDGVIYWTLCVISIFGTILFLLSSISIWYFEKRSKWIIVLQLGFENFAQGIMYIIVASSQASGSGNIHVSVIIGIVQALCFCGFQIFELTLLAKG